MDAPAGTAVVGWSGGGVTDEIFAMAADLARRISDEAATWDAEFDGGPGAVVSVSDAAHVMARYIATNFPQEWGVQHATVDPPGHVIFREKSLADAQAAVQRAPGTVVHRTIGEWRP
jgi:hypothetical protein